jgi:ubiquinone biosynthesis protein
MSVSLKPAHLKRYKDVAMLFLKYGRGDVVREAGLDEDIAVGTGSRNAVAVTPKAEELAADLERLGPTYVKLGQVLSTRGEFLPPSYLEALARLQDNVAPFPYEDVERIVEEELGVKIGKAFLTFEREPQAAASLGQVHRASLRDGRAVVVKVQRPNIHASIIEDLDAMAEIASVLDHRTSVGRKYEFSGIVAEFRKTLLTELDYHQEARNLTTLADALAGFDRIVVPRPVEDYSTGRILTMDFIDGRKITDVSPMALLEIDGPAIADQLFRAYLKQIFVDGFFHADPHPGNVFLTADQKIALLDLGMVARIAPRMQEQLLQMVLALSDGRSDEAADFALKIGERRHGFDERAFRRSAADVVGRTQGVAISNMQVGRIVLDMARHASETGLRLPPELSLLGKTLLQLDAVGRLLAPEFDPSSSIRDNASKIMNQRMLKSLSAGNVFSSMLEMKDLVNRLPQRVNRILDAAANNQLGIKMDTGIDAPQLMVGMQKVANRITVGLLLAALIVGAAMLMRVPTTFTILGYPGLAMIFFLGAGAGAVLLLFQIIVTDVRQSRAQKTIRSTISDPASDGRNGGR